MVNYRYMNNKQKATVLYFKDNYGIKNTFKGINGDIMIEIIVDDYLSDGKYIISKDGYYRRPYLMHEKTLFCRI